MSYAHKKNSPFSLSKNQISNSKQKTLTKKTIHKLFEDQVRKAPNNIALIHDNEKITYKELNERANSLAHYLIQLGVKPESIIALILERDFSLIVSILAVLKAGASYLPIDPNYPIERITFILQDCDTAFVLTNNKIAHDLSLINEKISYINMQEPSLFTQSKRNPTISIKSNSLAYIIYTSGSAGNPKGVLVEHCQVTRLFSTTDKWYHFNKNDRWVLFHSIAFDVSVWEVFGALLHGGSLVIASYQITRDPNTFYKLVEEKKITILNQTPSAFENFMLADQSVKHPSLHLRYIFFAGEALNIRKLKPWFNKHGDINPQLVNMYGTTETTVHATYRPLSYEDLKNTNHSPIGIPFTDLSFHLLDKTFKPVSIGEIGEIYIGGPGVSRGYLNREKLTAERFIPDPLSKKQSVKFNRFYRTGDLAKWLPSGELDFLGREDNQIKIRGFRVEPGEIECALLEHDDINQVVVVGKQLPNSSFLSLVAYLTLKNKTDTLDAKTIKKFLKTKLPDYMLPSTFIVLPCLPLTPHGKIDKSALPTPGLANNRSIIQPRNSMEESVRKFFSLVLQQDSHLISIDDDFFTIGGDSLLATQVVMNCRKLFDKEIPGYLLFETPTIEALCSKLELLSSLNEKNSTQMVPIEPAMRHEPHLLSFAQTGLWFLYQLQPLSAYYNVFLAFQLTGNLEVNILEMAFQTLINRHEILRTKFFLHHGEPYQQITPSESIFFTLQVEDFSHENVPELSEEAYREAQQPFDLEKAPLFRVRLLKSKPGTYILFLCFHHIIIDGWSIHLLFKEIAVLYQAYKISPNIEETLNPIQYLDFSLWQRQWLATSNVIKTQGEYWFKKLEGLPSLDLPTDYQRPITPSYKGQHYPFKIEQEITLKLRNLSKEVSTTLFVTLLSSFAIVLSRYTQQDDIIIGTPSASRHYSGTESIIGFFINLLMLRIELPGSLDVLSLLVKNHVTLMDAFAHQDIPFEKIVEMMRPNRETMTNPICSVLFVFQNYAHEPFNLEGLNTKRVFADNDLLLFGDYESSKFDITLYLQEQSHGLEGLIEYNTDLFNSDTIGRIVRYFQNVLVAIVEQPQKAISSLPLISHEDKDLLNQWNNTHISYPKDKILPQLFTEQANRTPQKIAAIFADQSLTYAELSQKVNQFTHYLIEQKVQLEDGVMVCLERSIDMLVILLAIMQAGGAYIPIDPSANKNKVNLLLQESRAKFLITDQKSLFSIKKVTLITLGDIKKSVVKLNATYFDSRKSKNLAYILYTSGTTGKPKGVAIEHRSLINFILAIQHKLHITENDSLLAITPYTFDISGLEFYLPLITGASCVIADKNAASDGAKINYLLQKHSITILQATPATWYLLLKSGWENTHGLKLLCGGEALSHALGKQLLAAGGSFWNLYGPTETTIWATAQWVDAINENTHTSIVPIGAPLSNMRCYVLDKNLQIAPIGSIGELYLAGDGLARCYLHRTDLTEESFVSLPSMTKLESKLYKTGDRVRWLGNGSIEYIERVDNQVKLRGFRIELSEIENHLMNYPTISQAVVTAHGALIETKKLIAYIIMTKDKLDILNFQALQSEQIQQWRSIYDEAYRQFSSDPIGLITSGWNSSYTGKPIPLKDMQTWAEITVQRILAFQPKNILEIGCGTGMILLRLLPYCQSYCGTDISESALSRIQDQQHALNLKTPLHLLARPAHQFQPEEMQHYDMIIMNSVVQYFPNIYYFITVLENAISAVCPGGRIFLGDIRNLKHLKAFCAAVQLTQAKDTTSFSDWHAAVEAQMEQEEELLISPEFFRVIAHCIPRISYITFQIKRGLAINEVSQFRYDVILHIEQHKLPVTPETCIDWQPNKWSVGKVSSFLLDNEPEYLAFQNVPNDYLQNIAPLLNTELLDFDKPIPSQFIKEKSSLLIDSDTYKAKTNLNIMHLERLWRISDRLPYDLEMYWSNDESLSSVDLIFRHKKNGYLPITPKEPSIDQSILSVAQMSQYANDPLKYKWQHQELENIQKYLYKKLPSYMLPSFFIIMDSFPLTVNGKVDRNALPSPDVYKNEHKSQDVTLPRNEIEKEIYELWSTLLGRNNLSIHDRFFDKGGHSLLAVQIIASIRSIYNINLSVKTLFEAPTIAEISHRIKQISDTSTSEAWISKPSAMITLQPNGQYTPLFLVHPIGGQILCYSNIIQKLHINRPIYAFEDPSLRVKNILFSDLKDMARYYLEELLQIQSHGPYYLGGYSMGGAIAVEMATQLIQKGETVAWVGVIDSWVLSKVRTNELSTKLHDETIIAEQYDLNTLLYGDDIFFKSLYKAHRQLLSVYDFPPISFPIILFKAQENTEVNDEKSNYWKNNAKNGLTIHLVPGSHYTMLNEINAPFLAKKIQQSLLLR